MLTSNATSFNCTTANDFVNSLRLLLNPKYYTSYRNWDSILQIVDDETDEPVLTLKLTSLKSSCFDNIDLLDEDELSDIAFIYVKYFEATIKPDCYVSLLPKQNTLIWHSEKSIDSFDIGHVTHELPASYYLKDASQWKNLDELVELLRPFF